MLAVLLPLLVLLFEMAVASNAAHDARASFTRTLTVGVIPLGIESAILVATGLARILRGF